MDPLKILYEEHRIIQKAIILLKKMQKSIHEIKAEFFEKVIDFFRSYADKCHHGKEEDILFAKLKGKNMRQEEKELLEELLEEHKKARIFISHFASSKDKGDKREILLLLQKIISLYEKHIEKENLQFFPSCLQYFSQQEKEQLLEKFQEFDQKLLHENYQKKIEEMQKLI